ncbi:MAG TPA: copper resistance system multicopper oxidase [Sulfurimonas sp.]|uniref:copper resistance system multicopper oxidase n=1 Tax=Sulfurimonas sp. TaxID=2022749 RepID=UPI002C94D02E|nr:copper resistance system multicopper oxidase [Sulfurimonas sp.]HUH42173.1 copper resistance system multicopper oxidase [Sulfurimonas sp.]
MILNNPKITRRQFVKGIAISSIVASNLLDLSAQETNLSFDKSTILSGDEFFLNIISTPVNITGTPAMATTINGLISGPTLRFKEGQDVTIHVTNHLNEDTSLHWHGMILPTNMDGVPGISFDGIKPTETFTYKFKIQQSGTYWYHSHSGFQEQTGVYGAIIIDPIEKDPYEYDKDYVITLSDWSDEKPQSIYRKLKIMGDYYNFKQRTLGDFFEEVQEKGFFAAFNERKMWNEMRMTDRDLSDVTGYTYTYLMNGYNPASRFKALFKNGDKIRLRFINSSSMTFFDVRIPGLKMRVVAADGNNIKPIDVDEFRIGVAETYDVIVEPQESKAYAIFAQSLDRSGYAVGSLTYSKDIEALIPKMDSLPILNHSDMGMNMNINMDGMAHDMPNMDMYKMGHEKDMVMPKKTHILKKDIPITPMEVKLGTQTTMKAEDPQYRLNDPGAGLRDNGRVVLTYADLKSLRSSKNDKYPDREIVLHLTGNMQRYMWSINGINYEDSKPLEFYYGERLRITYINDTMMNHPMHLHGMWSDLETGDEDHLLRKHTIVVQPGSKISFRVTVDAKGAWAYHCHLLYHMAGMFRKVIVV